MASRKFYRRLWTVNGIGLFLLIIVLLATFTFEMIERAPYWFGPTHERGLIVDERRDAARELDLSIQHVKYERPSAIRGSDYYLSEVVVLDKRIPREVREMIESAGDVSLQMVGATINVLFFNSDRTDVRPLLDRNAYVHRIDHPGRRTGGGDAPVERDYIVYEIALEDTNSDGRINELDARQFFLSDLTGRHLRPVTPDTLDLNYYWFSEDYSEIYFEQLVRDESRRHSPFVLEQRTLYYYNVPSGSFGRFDALEAAFGDIRREFGDTMGLESD